jgi:glutathione S-transferase
MDTSNSLQNVKIEYFAVNGKAALTRALLHWKQVPFVDTKYSFEEWGKLKKNGDYEFEQLPALESNGKRYFQSGAIVLFLAKQFGLLGSNADEEYLHTSILYSMEDITPKMYPAFYAQTEEAKLQQEAKRKEFAEVHCPFYLKRCEARFVKYGGKYAVGDTFSLSDFIYTVFLTIVFKNDTRPEFLPILLENAPTLSKHIENVAKNELAEFFEKGYISSSLF